MLKIYKKTGSLISKLKYVKYKNTLKYILRVEEQKYYESQFSACAMDIKATWKIINSLLNKNVKHDLIQMMKINNTIVNDKTIIVNGLTQCSLLKSLISSKQNSSYYNR